MDTCRPARWARLTYQEKLKGIWSGDVGTRRVGKLGGDLWCSEHVCPSVHQVPQGQIPGEHKDIYI